MPRGCRQRPTSSPDILTFGGSFERQSSQRIAAASIEAAATYVCAVSGERSVVPWTPHDLRRTVATRIAEQLCVGGEQLIKRVLGHADGSVTAIYSRYGYVKEMREVLERWSADLTAEFDAANMWSEPEMVRYVIVEPTEAA